MVAIFDKPVADNVWSQLLNRGIVSQSKDTYEEGDLERIAMYLAKDPQISQSHLGNGGKIGKVGGNTNLYVSDGPHKSLDIAENTAYLVIPKDTRLNRMHHSERVIDSIPLIESDDGKISQVVLNGLKNHGYAEAEATEIYNGLMDTRIPIPAEEKSQNKKLAYAAALTAAFAIASWLAYNKVN